MTEKGYINSAAGMIAAIREIGIVPLFKSPVSGWSIEELTHPDWWFYTSDKLGPWDWKIDAVHVGIIRNAAGSPVVAADGFDVPDFIMVSKG